MGKARPRLLLRDKRQGQSVSAGAAIDGAHMRFSPCHSGLLGLVFACVLGLGAVLPAFANEVPFDTWLEGLKSEARGRGISDKTLTAALGGAKPIDKVLRLDRSQPEFTKTFEEYLAGTVSTARIALGRKLYAENAAILDKIGKTYKVQPRFIVAFWGIESDYGRLQGGFPVCQALATLAWDGRRSSFFRDELLNALSIIEEGHVTAQAMTGSWAGAMGQTQFMPSSFRRFAVDYDGDGRRDIWTTRKDVFASIANYLAQSGWRDDETWGRRVTLPKDFDPALISLDVRKSLFDWQALGVRRADGSALPAFNMQGSLVQPTGGHQVFLVYNNYRTTLLWNRSTYFALAVGHLADAIGAGS